MGEGVELVDRMLDALASAASEHLDVVFDGDVPSTVIEAVADWAEELMEQAHEARDRRDDGPDEWERPAAHRRCTSPHCLCATPCDTYCDERWGGDR